jgi:tetratricopeptide (TPR) repeat protein
LPAAQAPFVGPLEHPLFDTHIEPPIRQDPLPSELLRAGAQMVAFHGRTPELERLFSWVEERDPLHVALITAPGGAGKTRLMVEVCHRLRQADTSAWFLREDVLPSQLAELPLLDRPRVLVVDYAETKIDLLISLLNNYGALANQGKPTLIVLLARQEGVWWSYVRDTITPLANARMRVASLPLMPLTPTREEREHLFYAAAHAFAAQRRTSLTLRTTPALTHSSFDLPLFVLMAALAFAHEGSLENSDVSLLSATLRRERSYWTRALASLGLTDVAQRRDAVGLIGSTLAVGTLWGGFMDRAELLTTMNAFASLPHPHAQAASAVIADLYPSSHAHSGLGVLRPDILGEHLVAHEFGKGPGCFDIALRESSLGRLANTLIVLSRHADRTKDASLLDRALNGRLLHLLTAILRVIIETGDVLRNALTRHIVHCDDDATVAAFVDAFGTQFDQTTALCDFAVDTARWALERAQDEEERIRCLLNLGRRLSESGRYLDAVPMIDDAIQSSNAAGLKEPIRFAPYLPLAYNAMSVLLAHCGLHREALSCAFKAVSRFKLLSRLFPGSFDADLAMTHGNLSIRLSDCNRHRSAQVVARRATALFRRLADSDPEEHTHNLATSLMNAAPLLCAVGLFDDAFNVVREGVDIYRRLAALSPDRFEPNLALGLSNLASVLERLDRDEDALLASAEAVTIYMQLAARFPIAFGEEYARTLSNHAGQLANAGRRREALVAARGAVSLRRAQVELNPGGVVTSLSNALHSLANVCGGSGLFDEGLTAIDEAIALLKAVSGASTGPLYEPELARSLAVRGSLLGCVGDFERAFSATQEALDMVDRNFDQLTLSHRSSARDMIDQYLECSTRAEVEPDMALVTRLLSRSAQMASS